MLLQSGLDNEWWADSMECYCYLRNIQDLSSVGRHHVKGGSEYHLNGPVIPFGATVDYHHISAKDQSRLHQFGSKVLPGIFFCNVLYAGGFRKGDMWSQTLRNWRRWTHQNSTPEGSMKKEVLTPHKKWKIHFSRSQMEQYRICG